MSRFADSHPIVSAAYFLSILIFIMFTSNPVLLVMGLVGAVVYCIVLEHIQTFIKSIGIYAILFIMIALTNPLFSHNGVTPLFFINGNAVTLEAILYGIDIATMLIAVMLWFRCFNNVMTSDKLLFIMGGLSPKIALVVSSALRFIPLFKAQSKKIRQTQKAMGLFTSDSWIHRIRGNIRIFSALVTWSLENAIDTGSSMRGRGYSLKGKSHFSMFRFRCSDVIMMILIIVLDAVVATIMLTGRLDFAFYPSVTILKQDIYFYVAIIAFFALAFLPVILEMKEKLLWTYYKSKI